MVTKGSKILSTKIDGCDDKTYGRKTKIRDGSCAIASAGNVEIVEPAIVTMTGNINNPGVKVLSVLKFIF